MSSVPDLRICPVNSRPVRRDGRHVLYWMIAQRRSGWNYALERAVQWCRELNRPLIVLEALRCGYEHASDRLHRFVLQGMADNARRLARPGVLYWPYVEPQAGAGRGLLETLAREAAVVVTDDYPCFFLPRMVEAAAERLDVSLEAVDSCGVLPVRATDRVFTLAHSFRRFLQKELPAWLERLPAADPLARVKLPPAPKLSAEVRRRWPAASDALLKATPGALAKLPIDHAVGPAAFEGGSAAAQKRLKEFLAHDIDQYHDRSTDPLRSRTTELSPYLHFGHVSAHQMLAEILQREEWSPAHLAKKPSGSREGWWGLSPGAEALLDQLITWRELGFNRCALTDDYARYESLPDWAQKTLAKHARDPRPNVYTLEQFEQAQTHDPLWNAAQMQLVRQGRLHNYLRMLWGKKILHWSPDPRAAAQTMIELNDKYAVDGRDPNSYSGIFWCLGRYDRAWGPERPIFGKIRYMSSESTARKLDVREYVRQFAPDAQASR